MSHSSIYYLRTKVSEKATNAAISFLKFLLIASECKSEMVTQTYTTHSKNKYYSDYKTKYEIPKITFKCLEGWDICPHLIVLCQFHDPWFWTLFLGQLFCLLHIDSVVLIY